MRARSLPVALVLLLAGFPAGCGADVPTVAVASPDALVLRAQELRSGPAPWERARLPDFSLYGGGRVIVPDEPAGALQRARDFRLSGDEFDRLVADAAAAGLDRANAYEDTDIDDASLWLVSLRTTDGLRTTRIAGHDVGRRAGEAMDYVENLPGAPPGSTAYEPTAMAVLATAGVTEGPAMPWPLHPLAEGTRTREGMCTVVTGDTFTEAVWLAGNARQETRWSSGGQLFAVSFRPLLPDEHTCQDIDVA